MRGVTAVAAVVTVLVSAAVAGVADAGSEPLTQEQAIVAQQAKLAAKARAKEPGLSPGTFAGKAFDTCAAPSAAQMKAWGASPYRALVVYFGGISRGCKQPNLTASWAKTQKAAGWKLIPLYVGLQAPCRTASKNRITPANASTEGFAAAADAVTQAKALGMARDSVLYFNMEAYPDDAACNAAVLTFLSSWTRRLHELGYLSGVYGEAATTIAALVEARGFALPDYVDFARWDNVVTLDDPAIPADYWPGKRRMKQYRGPHKETYGGVTINLDNDYLDVAPLPETTAGDFNGNGWSDLLAGTGDTLALWSGNGTGVASKPLGAGWQAYDTLTRLGDFTGDGRDDLISRDSATASLWLHPGTGTGFGTRVRIGQRWSGMRHITMAGDLNGDGLGDVVAMQTATGQMVLYPGKKTGFGPSVMLGNGDWREMDEVTGVGDVDGDGRGDLVARVAETGELRLYAGWGLKLDSYRVLHSSFAGHTQLTGAGDFDRDGVVDLVAIDAAARVVRYPIQDTGLGAPVTLVRGATGYRLA